jgi:hypothetical protein
MANHTTLQQDWGNSMENPRYWRLKAQRYRLEGSICPTCGQLIFPPRPVCPHCTAQPEQSAKQIISVSILLTDLIDVKAHIGYQITERLIA